VQYSFPKENWGEAMEDTTKSEADSEKVGKKQNFGEFTGAEKRTIGRAVAMMSQLAFTAVGCIFAGVFLGRFLDNLLGTSPWLMIVLIVFGCLAAFKGIIDVAKKF